MKKFEFSRYIKKFLPLIVIVCIVLTAVVNVFLKSSQSHIASTVIEFTNYEAESGLTPQGTELDINEIKASSIVSKVIYNLGLDENIYSIDSIISKIKTYEVLDEDEVIRKEALLDEGEEYEAEPTRFIVTFEASHDEGPDFARKVLDEIMNIYFSEYGEKYLNMSSTVNPLKGIDSAEYDYVEMMDIIDQGIYTALSTLDERSSSDYYFRSTDTGRTFNDLYSEFQYLQDIKVAELYGKIFEYQITKNKSVLLADYAERISQSRISNDAENNQINDILDIINDYVTKMRESGNTNISYEYILDEVYDNYKFDEEGKSVGALADHTVTYDELIYSWRDHTDTREHAIIQAAYHQYLIDTFNACKGTCGGTCGESGKTCSGVSNQYYDAAEEEVKEDISNLIEELGVLFDLSERTNNEYNEYLGAKNISTLSSVAVDDTINVGLYTAIAALFLLIVCCCGAILLGRIEDIISYVFYTDHLTGFANRNAFDSYLKKMDKEIFDDGVVCTTFAITNQVDINKKYGRDGGDEFLKMISGFIDDSYGKLDTFKVYNGNSQFFMVTNKTDYVTIEYIMKRIGVLIDEREKFKDIAIEYEVGMAETSYLGVHRIRPLLTKTLSNKEKYISAAAKPEKKRLTVKVSKRVLKTKDN